MDKKLETSSDPKGRRKQKRRRLKWFDPARWIGMPAFFFLGWLVVNTFLKWTEYTSSKTSRSVELIEHVSLEVEPEVEIDPFSGDDLHADIRQDDTTIEHRAASEEQHDSYNEPMEHEPDRARTIFKRTLTSIKKLNDGT